MDMNKKTIIQTSSAPSAIGPFSQAVGFHGLYFLSGQIPIDPHTKDVVYGGIEEQTRQVMLNLRAVLLAAGLDFSHVLKTTVYLDNMRDYEVFNRIYGEYFDENPPARVTIEVSRLPKDVLVEVDAIAAAPPEPDYDSPVEEAVVAPAPSGEEE